MASGFPGHCSILESLETFPAWISILWHSVQTSYELPSNNIWREKREREKTLPLLIHLRCVNLLHVLSTTTSNVRLYYAGQTHCYFYNLMDGNGEMLCLWKVFKNETLNAKAIELLLPLMEVLVRDKYFPPTV